MKRMLLAVFRDEAGELVVAAAAEVAGGDARGRPRYRARPCRPDHVKWVSALSVIEKTIEATRQRAIEARMTKAKSVASNPQRRITNGTNERTTRIRDATRPRKDGNDGHHPSRQAAIKRGRIWQRNGGRGIREDKRA